MSGIIFSKEFYEDERVEKIRSYCFKAVFRQSIALIMLFGLVIANANLLMMALIMQAFYYFLFRLCIYRDSAIVYVNEDELQQYMKDNSKKHCIMLLAQGAVVGALGGYISVIRPHSFVAPALLLGCLAVVAWMIALHWKSESLK